MRRILATAVLASLAACQDAPIHSRISKPQVTLEQARTDLAGCKLEAQKASGRPPMDESLLSLEAWSQHRSQTASLCLESKGYRVLLNIPGRCIGECVGPTEVVSR